MTPLWNEKDVPLNRKYLHSVQLRTSIQDIEWTLKSERPKNQTTYLNWGRRTKNTFHHKRCKASK